MALSASQDYRDPRRRHQRRAGRSALALVTIVSLLAVAAGCGGDDSSDGAASSGSTSSSKPSGTVNVGYIQSLVMTAVWSMPHYTTDITPKLVDFKSGVDAARALNTGDVDVAAVAYVQFLSGLAQGEDWVAVSGVARGGLQLTARRGIVPKGEIDDDNTRYTGTDPWKLLRGTTMAAIPGTFPDIACREYLRSHGLDPDKDVKIVTLPTFQDFNVSMARGDVDAACGLDPFTLIGRDSGSAVLLDYPYPKGDSNEYPSGDLNYLQLSTVLVAKASTVKEKPEQVQAAVAALAKSTDALNADPALRLKRTAEYLAFPPEIMAQGIDPESVGKDPAYYGGNYLDTNIYLASLQKWGPLLTSLGVTKKDVSADVPGRVDYSFLEKATGKTADDLGKSQ